MSTGISIDLSKYFEKFADREMKYCLLDTINLSLIVFYENESIIYTKNSAKPFRGELYKDFAYCYNHEELFIKKMGETDLPIKTVNGLTFHTLTGGELLYNDYYYLYDNIVKCDNYEVDRKYCMEYLGMIGIGTPIKIGNNNGYKFVDLLTDKQYNIICDPIYLKYTSGKYLHTEYFICPNVIYLLLIIKKNNLPHNIKRRILMFYQNFFKLLFAVI